MLRPAVSIGDIRPTTFDDFVGYEADKRSLRTSIKALGKDIGVAKDIDRQEDPNRNRWNMAYQVSSDNVLIIGLPGCGKTTLAEIYAMERARVAVDEEWPTWMIQQTGDKGVERWTGGYPNRPFRWALVEGRTLKTEEVVDEYLCHLQAYGTLIIDEFQQVDKKAMRIFYSLLHEGEWYSHLNGRPMNAWGFNIVATTTDESSIPDAIVGRFLTQIRLNSYTTDDMVKIVREASTKIGVRIVDDSVVGLLVERGRSNPRTVVSILSKARTILRAEGDSDVLTTNIVREASIQMGLGPLGLTKADVEVMIFLRRVKQGGGRGAVGANTLATVAKYGSVENYKKAEHFLISRSYVVPSSGGTVLMASGESALSLAEADPDFRFVDPSL
jgi:Holliday junction resolvasome RuvABC ATP-dependent DNA helicase subunit